ncbi:unnamed protein product [Schistocephalus solidus]|uniref:Reverse transcriptase domain-containing protein n=1 Tax=Schistocephalus solidus TaxID=70667 RepID=A0A183T5R6_SCHSO|nr:unnamed protein product [Schistocephalus solidus]
MWRQGQVPQDFKDATIVHLYKRKGNWQLCDNHRGISLLNIARKIFARILLNRLTGHLEQGLRPESKCGFRRHHGTTDMIFAARQLQEKCQEMRTHLYTTFVDLTKAFDTVNRDGLWKVMQKFGCPERFTHMVLQLHDGMTARVTDNGTVSEAFAVINGVKQGCVLTPTLISLMFSAMLMDAYRNEHCGTRIAYRTDGHLLDSRRIQAPTRVSKTTVNHMLGRLPTDGITRTTWSVQCVFCVEWLTGGLRIRLQWLLLNVAFMALALRGIRVKCGGTPRGGSGRASHLRPLPSPVFLTLS